MGITPAFRFRLSCAAAAAEHGVASSSASVNAKKPSAFRSQKPCAAAAAEHGAASSSKSVVVQKEKMKKAMEFFQGNIDVENR